MYTWVSGSVCVMPTLARAADPLTPVLAALFGPSTTFLNVVCRLPLASIFDLCRVTFPNFSEPVCSFICIHCSQHPSIHPSTHLCKPILC